ncbi:hypothetical protein GCM10022226_20820 [Sphaerisporangium flaviroseum]|uniref:Uncharacterized protein n=1 Tax=Sphaerisporangium flaviroseum TaxID=509199 RepID=A0ABP7HPB2_9ACTN
MPPDSPCLRPRRRLRHHATAVRQGHGEDLDKVFADVAEYGRPRRASIATTLLEDRIQRMGDA